MKPQKDVFLILSDIRSSANVGSIFRTADACGVTKIFLAGYTPAPLDRFGRVNKKLVKASLGAEKSVPWENAGNALLLIQKFQKENVFCVAVEQDQSAIDYKEIKKASQSVLVFGNEVLGVSGEVLQQCDAIAEIPMHGKKESLNVAVAVGIVLYGIF